MEKFQKLSSADLVEVVGGKRRTKKNWWWKTTEFVNGFWNGLSH
ncbi:hypothetical protein [Lactobacillus sp. LL6]|nr:hypothetical protein [Lactobacillus sp. LL6]